MPSTLCARLPFYTRRPNMSKLFRIIGAFLTVIGVIGLAIAHIASPSLIVSIGIRTIQTLKIAGIIVSIIGLSSITTSLIPAVKNLIDHNTHQKKLKNTIAEKQKTFDEYAKDSLNPIKTRERLLDLQENNPQLTNIVERCINQMNQMDALQDRYTKLLEANDATYLNDTVSAINDAETRLCRNIRNIINCCILVEDGTSQLSDFDNEIINKSFSENEKELTHTSTLIHYAVKYINDYQQNGVTDMTELKAWIDVMKTSTTEKTEATNETL